MKYMITVSSLLLSQLIAAEPAAATGASSSGDASLATMTEHQKQGTALLVEYKAMMQGIDPTFNIQAVRVSNLPACFASEDPEVQSKLIGTSSLVNKLKGVPGAKTPILTYCDNVLARIAAIALMVEARKTAEQKAALVELEKMAADEGLCGDATTRGSVAPVALVNAGGNDTATTSGTDAVAAHNEAIVPNSATTAAGAAAAEGRGAAAFVTAVSTTTLTTAAVVATNDAATQAVSPFAKAMVDGREKLRKACPTLFSPSNGWFSGLRSVEYATVRSPALVELVIPFLGSLSEDASYVEFKGTEAARIIELIAAFKAAFRSNTGVPFSGSQEASFLSETTVEAVTAYTLSVKANAGDAPAETVIIEVDKTDPENIVVKGSTPEMKALTRAVF